MTIPVSQLMTWATLPDASRSAATYNSIKSTLDASGLSARYTYDIYLQGSYANHTNIRSDSDVDIVIELTSMFRSDLGRLSGDEIRRYQVQYSDSSITLQDFRQAVLAALRRYYSVTEGNKCLKVAGGSSRLPADVLVCNEYRLWSRLPLYGQPDYVEGIIFRTLDGREVINYPKEHRNNGTRKQAATDNEYKELVRTIKNARRRLVEDGTLSRDSAPSYFVECLLYNLPNPSFTDSLSLTYLNALVWLGENHSTLSGLLCQNEITHLFGSEPEQWDTRRAQQLIGALLQQWNDWGE